MESIHNVATWLFDYNTYIQLCPIDGCPYLQLGFWLYGSMQMHGSCLNNVLQLYDNSCNFNG
jgi:hypothetical protein